MISTTPSSTKILVTPITISTTTSTSDKSINNEHVVYSNSFAAPTTSSLVSSRAQNGVGTNNGFITSSYTSPVNIGCLKIKTETEYVQPQSSGLPSNYNRAIIHSSLISNQPVSFEYYILYA